MMSGSHWSDEPIKCDVDDCEEWSIVVLDTGTGTRLALCEDSARLLAQQVASVLYALDLARGQRRLMN